jgi:P4 family phage/plasmid primase-like protien
MDYKIISQLADAGFLFAPTAMGMTRSNRERWQNIATNDKKTLFQWIKEGNSLVSVAKHGYGFNLDIDDLKAVQAKGFKMEWLGGYYLVDTPSGGIHGYGIHTPETETLGNLAVVHEVKGDTKSKKIFELKLNNQSVAAPTAIRLGQPKKVDGQYVPRERFQGTRKGLHPDLLAWITEHAEEPKPQRKGCFTLFHNTFDLDEFLENETCTEYASGMVDGAFHVVVEECPHCGKEANGSTLRAGITKFIFGGNGYGFVCHACGVNGRDEHERLMCEADADYEPHTGYIYQDDDPQVLFHDPRMPVEDANTLAEKTTTANSEALVSNDFMDVGDYDDILCTDVANGKRLARLCGNDLAYVIEFNSWYVWNSRVWAEDKGNIEVTRKAKDVAKSILCEAANYDEDKAEAVARWALTSCSKKRLDAMIYFARSEGTIARSVNQFDAAPHLFNCANGVIDLRAGELLPHDRKYMMMKISPAKYDLNAKCPTWLSFLDRIQRGDQNMIEFLQRSAGYSMVGSSEEESLNFLWGGGRNGKGKFLGSLMRVFGEYAGTLQFKALLDGGKGSASGPSEEIACLAGKRMVVAQESNVSGRFNEALVKTLTGRDEQRARKLHQNSFEFMPVFTLWLASNNKPRIVDTSDGMKSRIKLVPFTVQIPEKEIDKRLPDKLWAERDGILTWCVRGAVEWYKRGLDYPGKVVEATVEYFKDEDVIGHWLEERAEIGEYRSPAGDSYKSFKRFAEENGFYVVDSREFKKRLEQKGFEHNRTNTGAFWLGFRLASSCREESELRGLEVE